MKKSLPVTLVSGAVAALAVFAVAGCAPAASSTTVGSSGGSSPGASAATGSGSGTTGSTGTSQSGPLNGVPKACPGIAEVGSTLGIPIDSVAPSAGLGALQCNYHHGAATQAVAIISFTPLKKGESSADYGTSLAQYNSDVKPVSGIGDAAFSFAGDLGPAIGVVKGTTVCVITETTSGGQSAVIAMARKIVTG